MSGANQASSSVMGSFRRQRVAARWFSWARSTSRPPVWISLTPP